MRFPSPFARLQRRAAAALIVLLTFPLLLVAGLKGLAIFVQIVGQLLVVLWPWFAGAAALFIISTAAYYRYRRW
jgi:hypothetical protein